MFAGSLFRLQAQDYSAVHGSGYFGSLGVYNNPASIVTSPYKWDVTLFGVQYQTISNAVRGPNFPLVLSPNSVFDEADGDYKRFADVGFNLRLLNTRISLDKNHALAFGFNLRGNTQVNTSQINYNDSIKGPRTFLFYNQQNNIVEADLSSSTWMEVYGSYGLSIWDNETSRFNAGASVKLLRGLSGVFARVNNVRMENEERPGEGTVYKISGGEARYGYSANHGNFESFSAGDLFSGARTGFAIDLGAEYMIKTQAVTSVYDDQTEHDYEWKIGLSLLDIGWNNYTYSDQSRAVSGLRDDISSSVLTEKFSEVDGVAGFNDSLSTIVNNYDTLSGSFSINNPTRAVINVDRYVSGNFFVNAELSVNLAANSDSKVAVKQPRLLTVTPRWENRKLGFYLPVQVTSHGNFWIGGAVKAGPLLLGTHNLLNAFSKKKYPAGGAYLAIVIRPVNLMRDARNRQYECPEY